MTEPCPVCPCSPDVHASGYCVVCRLNCDGMTWLDLPDPRRHVEEPVEEPNGE